MVTAIFVSAKKRWRTLFVCIHRQVVADVVGEAKQVAAGRAENPPAVRTRLMHFLDRAERDTAIYCRS